MNYLHKRIDFTDLQIYLFTTYKTIYNLVWKSNFEITINTYKTVATTMWVK